MKTKLFNILLADDDIDDCSFFKEALEKLSLNTIFNVVNDGEKLMFYLQKLTSELPDVLFLDLNMHRKNGFECLNEIKKNPLLKNLPVIVFSTSFDQERVDMLYKSGAQYFMRKLFCRHLLLSGETWKTLNYHQEPKLQGPLPSLINCILF